MNILEQEQINPSTLGLLIYISLNRSNEYIHNIIRQYIFEFTTDSGRKPVDILEEAGYIKFVQGAKSRPWENIRLSDKGKQILKEMNEKDIHPLSQYTLDYVKKEYERIGADKKYIQGGGKLLHYISEFLYSRPVDYTERMVRAVITCYCDSFQEEGLKYLNKMGTLFFKPANAYATKFTVEESPICKFIEVNSDKIKYYYKKV